MVTLRTVDRLVGLIVAGIIVFGGYSWWQATRRSLEQRGMMGQMMGTMPGTDPIWYFFGTLIAVSVVLGTYIMGREALANALSPGPPASAVTKNNREESDAFSDPNTRSLESPDQESSTNNGTSNEATALTFLPEDERRVVKPILDSPGLTQVELRGRSDFSKAKVSQTVSELEERGLIYREKQGRTFRVYPGELLKERRRL